MKLIFWDKIPIGIGYPSKIFLIMKLIVFFMTLGLLQLSANSYSQKVTYSGNNIQLERVLKSIEKQTGYFLFYKHNEIKGIKPINNISLKNVELKQALTEILKDQPLDFFLKENTIIISRKEVQKLTMVTSEQSAAEVIKGIVTDQDGRPLRGASIRVKNGTQETMTDVNGVFTIREVTPGMVLLITFTGFERKEIVVNNSNELRVSLKTVEAQLDDVVVIGYGKQKKELLTSAIGSLKIQDEDIRQVSSPTRLLEGRIAGVNLSLGSGNLASGERVSIRGFSSITAGNDPLYVVDGIPLNTSGMSLTNFGEEYSPLAALNHADIESIEVLKDAASAAIYGSRASNGVILITTRSGKDGKSQIKVDISTGYSQFANKGKLKMANSDLYLLQYNEGASNYNSQYNLKVGDSGFRSPIMNPFYDSPDTDWLGLILQKGYFKNLNSSFSGGTAKTNYYFGIGLTKQEGVVKNNEVKKVNLNTKFSHKLNDWLEIGTYNKGNFIRNNQVPGASLGSTIIARAIEQRPFDRPYKPNGDYYVGGTDELVRHNPVQILNEQDVYVDNYRYLGTFYGQVNISKNLNFKSSYNADIGYTYDYTYYNENHPYGTGVGKLVDYNRFIVNNLFENVLNYNQTFNRINISGVLGHSWQKQSYRTVAVDARGFPSPSFGTLTVASEIFNANGSVSEYAMESYFGRATAAYADKYILTATLRTDGSSKFPKHNRWGVFPSVSIGWNVSKESFMEHTDMDLKLRSSWGKTGNQEGIGNYSHLPLISGGKNYGNVSGIAVSSFGNENLTWEKANQFDLGFDLSLFNKKIDITFDTYYKKTTDLLYSMPVHATTGMTALLSNIGSMENKGVELSISSSLQLGAVQWRTNFNIAHNRNKILSLLEGDAPIAIGDNRAIQVGRDIGSYYLFEADGLYQYDGEIPKQQFDLGVRAGDVRWTDVDNNGIINDNDRVVLGSSNPKFNGGWNNTFKYKNLQLDILMTYMYGQNVYAAWKPTGLARIGHTFGQLEEYITNRWTGPGTTDVYPRTVLSLSHNNKNSTRFLEDGSFIRMRAVTLAYTLPSLQINKFQIKNLRIFGQADNLFLLTKYSGWDPEVNTNLDPRYSGVDLLNNPQPRTFTIGTNINF